MENIRLIKEIRIGRFKLQHRKNPIRLFGYDELLKHSN
jgi:hypothetical protein